MRHRTYYGEYSISHWVKLLLTRNIVLPDYQRSFVWQEKDVNRLIASLSSDQFVQPVTIGNCVVGGVSRNYILDGQQRLTSLLLTYLGYMPDRDKFQEAPSIATGDDSNEDDQDCENNRSGMEWTFERMLSEDDRGNTADQIRQRLREDDKYTPLPPPQGIDIEKLFNDSFLGFSYIVPDFSAEADYARYYSPLFRNINYLGMKLSALESRRSLYFMNTDYVNFLDGQTQDKQDVLGDIRIMENLRPHKIDFVRYLSILSQYHVAHNASKVMMGYSSYSVRENFYADYVSYLLKLEQSGRPNKFDGFSYQDVFGNGKWEERFNKLRDAIQNCREAFHLNENNAFTSWVDADLWLFGMIYFTLFEGQEINISDTLKSHINDDIAACRQNDYYMRNSNRLGITRDRIQASIDIYQEHAG